LSARREQFEIGEVSVKDGQIFDVLLVELDVHIGAIRLELREVARDFDGLRDFANLHGRINARGSIRGNRNTRNIVGFEARGLYVNLVGIRN